MVFKDSCLFLYPDLGLLSCLVTVAAASSLIPQKHEANLGKGCQKQGARTRFPSRGSCWISATTTGKVAGLKPRGFPWTILPCQDHHRAWCPHTSAFRNAPYTVGNISSVSASVSNQWFKHCSTWMLLSQHMA